MTKTLQVSCVQMHWAKSLEFNLRRTHHYIGLRQQPVGPNSKMFHCVANTIGESPDGKQTSIGSSFIREPSGIPLAEAGFYQEEMITSVLDLARADRSYILDSMKNPPFLARHWQTMIRDMEARKDLQPE